VKVLLDHNVPHWLRGKLPGHEVHTTRWVGWDDLSNGELLAACAAAAYDVFLSIDKKLEYEHDLTRLPVTIVVLDVPRINPRNIDSLIPATLDVLARPLDRALYVIRADGDVLWLAQPRPRP